MRPGEEVNYSVNKATINHKLATYTAITQLLDNNNSVKLVLDVLLAYIRIKKWGRPQKHILNGGLVDIVEQ